MRREKTWKQCRGLDLEICSCCGNHRHGRIQTLRQFSPLLIVRIQRYLSTLRFQQKILKCSSALGECVPLGSATVVNIRILLKATSYFSASLHYVLIFTSRIVLSWVDFWVYHCLNLKLRLRQYLSTLFNSSLSYHKYYKGTNDKDIRNDFTILYVRDLILLNTWYTIFAISKPITCLSLLLVIYRFSQG